MIKISAGDLPLPQDISVSRNGNNLEFSWGQSSSNYSPYDQVVLLAYNGEKVIGKHRGQFRKDGIDTLELPENSDASFYVYLFFIADDRSRQSESVYLGQF